MATTATTEVSGDRETVRPSEFRGELQSGFASCQPEDAIRQQENYSYSNVAHLAKLLFWTTLVRY